MVFSHAPIPWKGSGNEQQQEFIILSLFFPFLYLYFFIFCYLLFLPCLGAILTSSFVMSWCNCFTFYALSWLFAFVLVYLLVSDLFFMKK